MSEQIITKRCSHCKEIKPLSEFGKDKSREDGYQHKCKICSRAFSIRFSRSKEGKAKRKQYRQSEKGNQVILAAKKRFWEKHGTKKSIEYIRTYRKRHPEIGEAHSAVYCAQSAGRLPRPETLKCSCGEQAKHYHHHKGYAPEHHLDVIPLCIPCHIKLRSTS